MIKNPSDYGPLKEILGPVRAHLHMPLAAVFRDSAGSGTERNYATNLLKEYAADQPKLLADLLMDADFASFNALFTVVPGKEVEIQGVLREEIAKTWKDSDPEDRKETLARRQARAVAMLIRMGKAEEALWGHLRHQPDPRVRSYIVNWLAPLKVDPQAVADRFKGFSPGPRIDPVPGKQITDTILFHPETSEREGADPVPGSVPDRRVRGRGGEASDR